MKIKNVLFIISLWTWQLSRFFCAITLFAALAYFIFLIINTSKTTSNIEEHPTESICGRLADKTLVIPRKYVAFWAEYEGESTWDKNTFLKNRGCDVNFTSLPMIVTWPDFQTANHSQYFREGLGFQGIEIDISPANDRTLDLRSRLDAYLGNGKNDEPEGVTYDERLELYTTKRRNAKYPEYINEYYWREESGETQAVFECLGKGKAGIYSCKGQFFISELKSIVKVRFTPEKLTDWKNVVVSVRKFIMSRVID